MTNPYKRMYVLTEDEYQLYKSTLHETNQPAPVKCPEDGREFPNANMLGHHLKTHVNGLQCNLCGKVFKTKRALTAHLKRHPLRCSLAHIVFLTMHRPQYLRLCLRTFRSSLRKFINNAQLSTLLVRIG